MDITELKAIIDANIFENTSQAITGDALNDVLNLIADSLGEYVPVADIFDESGTIRSALLPSYVDDVLEFSTRDAFPAVGEGGKIYLAADTNLSYRWGGSEYVIIAQSLALGETSSTAYRGDRGKIAYDHSQTSHRLSIAGLEVSALGGSIDSDALASALSIPELRTALNKIASYFYIDEATGNLVTDRNVIIRKNLTVGGDTTTGGKGEDTGVSGTVTGIRVDANTILEPTNGIVDMSDVLANIDVDLSNYYTKQETTSEIAKAVDGLNLGQYAKASDLATLQTEVDNIESVLGMDEEAAGIINTWEEVKAFLDGYSSSDDLATILSAMNADIAKRALASDLDALALTVGDNTTNIRNLKASVYTKDDLAAYKSWWDDLMSLIVKEGNDIKIKTNLIVTGDTTTGEKGSDAGTSGTVIGVVVNGQSYKDETNGMLDLSTLMNQYALTSAIPSLEGYAKIADVSAALAGYQPLITASNKLDYSLIANTPAIPTAASLGLKALAYKDSLAVADIVGLQSALSSKQDAATAITTSNIGSQSVNYATSAGNASTLESHPASYFATASSLRNYLPLSGGTVTGKSNQAPLVIDAPAMGNKCGIRYENGAVVLGYLGFSEVNTPAFRRNDASNTKWNVLYHSGNLTASVIDGLGTLSNNISGNAATATKLQTPRTIWGQSFDGTGNVSGALTEVTDITASGNATIGGDVTINGNLIVKGDTTTGGTGSDAGTSGTVIGVVVNGQSYKDETNGMLDLSTLMNQYALTSAIPSLEGYAKIADVSAALAGYQPLITASNKLDYSLIANTPTIPTAASLGLKALAYEDSLAVADIVGLQSALSNKQDVLGYAPIPRYSNVSDYSVWNDSDWGFSTWYPHTQNAPEYWGTSFNFRSNDTWYYRLMFSTSGRIYYYSGINTTTMTNQGTLAYLSDIPTNNNQLTNGTGYITSAGSCAYATSAGNADTLDGQHANSFVITTAPNVMMQGDSNAFNNTSGLRVFLSQNNSDFGGYGAILQWMSNPYRSPSDLISDNWVFQLGGNTEGRLYWRNQVNGYGWTAWREIYHLGNCNNASTPWSCSNLTASGNLIIAGDTATGSDIRFKDIIEDHRIALESIAQAPLFTFKWNDREDDTIHLGTSAQYWEEVAPWLVKGTDFKVLDYSTLGVAIGISLANKTVNLEERVKALEKENEQLKKQIYGS